MIVNTRHFGEVELDEDKIIYFENGIFGFEEYQKYILLYDDTDGVRPDVSWLQSIDEASLSIPVISPFIAKPDYNPEVEDELLKSLGELNDDNTIVFVSITVPSEVEKITANLKAPFIINSMERKGVQLILDNSEFEVKYQFYNQLMAHKSAKGGK